MKTFSGELILPGRENQKAFLQGLFFSKLRENSSDAITVLGKLIPQCEALLRNEKVEMIGSHFVDRRPIARVYEMLWQASPEGLQDDASALWHKLKQWQVDFYLTADWCRQRAIAEILNAATEFIFGNGVTEEDWNKGSKFYDLTLWPMLSVSTGIEIYNKVREEIETPDGWQEYQPLNWTRQQHFDLNVKPALDSHLDANCYTRDRKIKDWRQEFVNRVWEERVKPYCKAVESAYIRHGCERVPERRKVEEHMSLTVKVRLMGKNVLWNQLAKANGKRSNASIECEKRRMQKAVREMLKLLDLPLEPTIQPGKRGRREKEL